MEDENLSLNHISLFVGVTVSSSSWFFSGTTLCFSLVHYSYHLPAHNFENFLKVIYLSSPCAVPSICLTSVGLMHGTTVCAISLGFVYIFFLLLVLLQYLPDFSLKMVSLIKIMLKWQSLRACKQ